MKVAFFGDHLLEDVQATHEFSKQTEAGEGRARWDAFAIIEEFANEDKAYEQDTASGPVRHDQRLWGQSYFLGDRKQGW